MTRRARKGKATKQIIESTEEDLNRFAGSSDEEDNVEDSLRNDNNKTDGNDNHDDSDDENDDPSLDDEYNGDTEEPSEGEAKQTKDEKDGETEEESVDNEAESSDDDDEGERPVGMANAMAKILGTGFQKPVATPVLAKTTTPLQRQAQKEKEEESKQREKRRIRKEERTLKALHVPLSVPTTRSTGGKGISTSVAKELEQERMHRRIATRGVVALFNAVAQHQNSAENEINPNAKKSTGDVKKMTKHGFLDMIKTAAKEQQASGATTTTTSTPDVVKEKDSTTKKPQWNALQDDFMLNPKKNWDQESSSDDDDNQENSDGDEPAEHSPGSKKRRLQEKDGAIKAKRRGIRAN